MLTLEKLRIYKRYKGDIDGFSRANNVGEQNQISDQDWREIDELAQRLSVESSGLAAKDFVATTDRLLKERTPNAATADELRNFVKLL